MGNRILLADDDPDLRFLIEMSLNEAGYEVMSVSNGREAVDSARKEPFDVILLDAEMPVMDGFEAYRTLCSLPETANIPVIFLTARTPDESIRKSLTPFHFILKPFDADRLPETIRQIAKKG
ncbi:MAG TPA: response regulator [Acidobacteriota bacterium]|nr:response regulator [Acidobacteriota bacterium]